jgi:transposase
MESGMLSFVDSLKVYVAVEPCDMRKSFEGLAAHVTTVLKRDLHSGALFVFSNRLKILYCDRTGLWVLAKRLERGNPLVAAGRGKVHRVAPGSVVDADRWS